MVAVAWIFFVFGMIVSSYFVFANLYHWLRYGFMYPAVWVAFPMYLIGVFIFISIMIGAITTL